MNEKHQGSQDRPGAGTDDEDRREAPVRTGPLAEARGILDSTAGGGRARAEADRARSAAASKTETPKTDALNNPHTGARTGANADAHMPGADPAAKAHDAASDAEDEAGNDAASEALAFIKSRSPIARRLYLAAGWFNVGLAVIGAILPVMPTVIFLIIAAACFANSNPKLEARLLTHPVFGEHIVAWRRRRAITKKGKWGATLGMLCGAAFGLVFLPTPWRYVGTVVALIFIPWVWSRPDR